MLAFYIALYIRNIHEHDNLLPRAIIMMIMYHLFMELPVPNLTFLVDIFLVLVSEDGNWKGKT